jgi:hypothetical protein
MGIYSQKPKVSSLWRFRKSIGDLLMTELGLAGDTEWTPAPMRRLLSLTYAAFFSRNFNALEKLQILKYMQEVP